MCSGRAADDPDTANAALIEAALYFATAARPRDAYSCACEALEKDIPAGVARVVHALCGRLTRPFDSAVAVGHLNQALGLVLPSAVSPLN